MIFIRTWNALSWSCSRKPLIKMYIWRNYVIKGVGELFKGVVAKNIYHNTEVLISNLFKQWINDHDFHHFRRRWMADGIDQSWELYIQNTHSLQVKLLFQWSYFLSAKTVFGQMQLKSQTYFIATSKRWILCAFTFFLFVCGCSYQRCPRLVWEELKNSDRWKRFSSYLSLHSCEVHHLVLHSSSQDLFHPNRFKVLLPGGFTRSFSSRQVLYSSSQMDSQDLFLKSSFPMDS